MKKLSLDLDALLVESFETSDAPQGRGTVRGHTFVTCDFTCEGGTWNPEITCNDRCGGGDSVGLSACCYSQECTGNPNDFQCINSYNYCFETQRQICATEGICV